MTLVTVVLLGWSKVKTQRYSFGKARCGSMLKIEMMSAF
jgi:hypothetical protein